MSNNPYKDDKLYIKLSDQNLRNDIFTPQSFKFTLSQRGQNFGQFFDVFCVLSETYLHIFEDKETQNYVGSLDLNFMMAVYFKDEISNNRYGIRFIHNCITQEL